MSGDVVARAKAALAAWDCVHVVAQVDVIADIPNTVEDAYRQAPAIVRDLVSDFEQVHTWGHQAHEAIQAIRDIIWNDELGYPAVFADIKGVLADLERTTGES